MSDDQYWLRVAINLARKCPPSSSAFSVGTVVVKANGELLATGYSRETGPIEHAEETAIDRLPVGLSLVGATLYSSLEPCGHRASKPVPCAALIAAAGIARVVYAWREPPTFVSGADGAEQLAAAGVNVLELHELSGLARTIGVPVRST